MAFKLDSNVGAQQWPILASTPLVFPAASHYLLYIKSSTLYRLDSSGVETIVSDVGGAVSTHNADVAAHGQSANGHSLITAADYAAMRVLLALVIGTNVQAQDTELSALAGLTSAADKGIQFTGVGTAGTFDLSAAGRAILDDADAAAQRTTLGLGTAATQNTGAFDASGAATSAVGTHNTDATAHGQTANGHALISAANYAAMRTLLGLVVGTDVQAYSAATSAYLTRVRTVQALTDGASITWDVNSGATATVTLGGNRTLANPTNLVDGESYVIHLTQDSTGTRTLAYGSAFKWAGGVAPVLSTAIGAIDTITLLCKGSNLHGSILKGFA